MVVQDNRKVFVKGHGMRRASIGLTRQWCLENAGAEWVSFVDDDDNVPTDYVSRALEIITGDDPPDVVGFRLRFFQRRVECGAAVHSYDAAKIPTPNMPRGWKRYERQPNHLNPIRREWAMRVGYKPLNFGEDGDYAIRLGLLKPRPREVFIDGDAMYHYLFEPDKLYEHPAGK